MNVSTVTVCLTNWRRPKSLKVTIDSLVCQSVRPVLFLWNNGPNFANSHLAWVVRSSLNELCWPRWLMASFAKTEYICIMDDDIRLTDRGVLESAIDRLSRCPSDCIVGAEGVNLLDGRSYRNSDHIRLSVEPLKIDTCCDLIKGKFMLLRAKALRERVPLAIPESYREDDIAISGLLARGLRKQHLCLTTLSHRFSVVDEPNALSNLEGHYDRRQLACERYFWLP